MRLNYKICSVLVISFSAVTISLAVLSLFKLVSLDITMIFLGITSLFSGLNVICMPKQPNPTGIVKHSKIFGMISIIAGTLITVAAVAKAAAL